MMRTACIALVILGLAPGSAAFAEQICAKHPYAEAAGALSDLSDRLDRTLAAFPSLAQALTQQAPSLCLDDGLVEEQGYYEPKTNRIVLNSDLNQDFQLAILIHEIRNLEQFDRGYCPTIADRLTDYISARLALEADASAIGDYIAWKLREGGDSGPWDSLATWPMHDDLVSRFASEIAAGADEVAATSATFAQWYERAERREIYTFAICSNYLDAPDREKVEPGAKTVPPNFAALLCRMPDGRPYDCTVPP